MILGAENKKKKAEDEESNSINLDSIEQRLKSMETALESIVETNKEMRTQLLDKGREEKGWFFAGILMSTLVGLMSGLWIE